jgi:hypothetical protein
MYLIFEVSLSEPILLVIVIMFIGVNIIIGVIINILIGVIIIN